MKIVAQTEAVIPLGSGVTPARRGKDNPAQSEEKTPVQHYQSMTWTQYLKRVFNIDVSICEKSRGEVKTIVSIDDQAVIDKALYHLLAKGVLAQPPKLLPAARASPESNTFT
jgi:hypothetical protein